MPDRSPPMHDRQSIRCAIRFLFGEGNRSDGRWMPTILSIPILERTPLITLVVPPQQRFLFCAYTSIVQSYCHCKSQEIYHRSMVVTNEIQNTPVVTTDQTSVLLDVVNVTSQSKMRNDVIKEFKSENIGRCINVQRVS